MRARLLIPLVLMVSLGLPGIAAAQCSTDDADMNGVPDVCPAGTNYIEGGPAGEFIWGTTGADCIFGLGGNDLILGRGGDDYICGGDGGDTIFSGGGADSVFGEAGDDFVVGGGGGDVINGGAGDDTINGGAGNDTLSGEDGNDTLNGGSGDDILSGGNGTDTLDGGGGTNVCREEVPGTSERLDNCAVTTHVSVDVFEAQLADGGVLIRWQTRSEVGTVAFRLWRIAQSGALEWVGEAPASPVGAPHGASYLLQDPGAPVDQRLEYILEERTLSGGSVQYGPFAVVPEPTDPSSASLPADARGRRVPHPVALERFSKPAAAQSRPLIRRKSTAAAAELQLDRAGLVEVDAFALAEVLGRSTPEIHGLILSGRLRLTLGDRVVAWHAAREGAALRFVAPENRSPFSRFHRYLLSIEEGTVMDAMELLPGASSEPHVYLETKRFEENLFAGPAGGPDPRADLFFWHGLLADDEVRIAVALPGLGEPMAQELRLIVHGASAHPEQPHRIELRWNGERLGVFDVFGRQRHTIRVPMDGVAAGLENELTVVHHRAGDAPPALYLDAVEVDYARLARADGPALWFGAGGQGHCTVTGLSAELAHLYDVSDPDRPQHYGEAPIDETGTLRFACDDPGRRFLVATTESVLAPSAVHAHHVMDLRSPRGGADYLIIAPSHLLADAQGLAEYREADGYRVLVVDVDDVFWAFADGEPDPIAIRDFLSFAVGQWDEPPRFVTLVGKGSFDYRDLQGLGGNWIPPMLAPTEGGLFPSDSMLGDLSGDDGVPEIAVGRLPISKGEELSAILASIERFEKGHTSMNALFASDDSEHEEFSAATDLLTKAMPPNRVEELDLNVETLEGARAQLFSLWQSPLSWLSYVGHGGLDRLADEGWLTSDDVPSLAALNSAPVLLGWSCNILRFDIPGYSSLGEKLVVQGASAGVFSATGWSNHVESDAFRAAFSEAAFTTEAETIGEAMLIAHKAAANARLPLHRVYMLLGDPALRLRPPRKPAESAPPSPEEPSDSVGLPRTADSSSDSSAGCEITSAGSARGPFDLVVLILCAIVWIRRGGRVSDRHRHLH